MADNSALPLLYSYRRCPYAMRARLAMLQANRRFQTFEILIDPTLDPDPRAEPGRR